ncbi:MAG TPA: adenosine kinase [Rhizomicrobium sp.]|jgi:sugar/nucleoside kinase (ribokinase family)|nr:adenosine kinase [Rhizomicrobium sp.]
MSKYDVAGMGNAIVDVIAGVDDKFLLDHAIAKNVMTLIDEFRAETLYGALPDHREIAGGSAANTMAGLASLGGRGIFVGKVKNDRLGASFADSMKDIGVHFDVAAAKDGPSTACCLIAVTPDGHRSMNTYLGASREIGPHDVREADVADSQVLYIEGYLWDQPDAKAAINKAMAAAKSAGRKIAFTLSDPFCVARYRDEFRALLEDQLDILFANEEEAKALFEVEEFDDVLERLRGWHGIAAITRSEKGCVIVQAGDTQAISAFPVKEVVDTTGAGDQFAAGFLFGLTNGFALEICGKLGGLAAAEVISHYGARPETSLRELAQTHGLI